MRRKKNSPEILILRSLKVICKNCGKETNKFRYGNYSEERKFCCHKCATDYYKKHFPQGDKHHLWKGKNASYITQHQWINRNYGKASCCEMCRKKLVGKFHWANISGKYLRNIKDYKQLCVSCHIKFNHIQKYGDLCRNGHPRPPESERKGKNGKWKECPFCRREKYAKKILIRREH